MSMKENVNYVKDGLSNEEKFLENFVKGERFFNKYKTLIIAFVIIIVIGVVGTIIKKNIDSTNKYEANVALNNFLETGDKEALATLKETNEELYNVALYLQAKKDNTSVDINIPSLKELSKFQFALENSDIEQLSSLSMQNDFLLKEFALFYKALLLSNNGKYEEAKTALKQIPQNSKASELANLLNHYLLTK